MRKTPRVAAAAACVLSYGLLVPSAQATVAPTHLVGVATCEEGGAIRLDASLDTAGVAKADATIRGVRQKHWAGEVMAGLDASSTASLTRSDFADAVRPYKAVDGTFAASASKDGATAVGGFGLFMTTVGQNACTAFVLQDGSKYAVMGGGLQGGDQGLAIAAGRSAVAVMASGKKQHRYRATFTLVGASGNVEHRTVERLAKKKGEVDLVVRDFHGVSAFGKAAVTVVDLTDHKAKPTSYSLVR